MPQTAFRISASSLRGSVLRATAQGFVSELSSYHELLKENDLLPIWLLEFKEVLSASRSRP